MERAQDFKEMKCQIVAVSVNKIPDSGREWIQKTHTSFSLLQNPSADLYLTLGMRRRLKTIVTLRIMEGFVERHMSAGAPLPKLYEGDDLLTSGTDIMVDFDRKLLYMYSQEKYSSRPDVQDLLHSLKTY